MRLITFGGCRQRGTALNPSLLLLSCVTLANHLTSLGFSAILIKCEWLHLPTRLCKDSIAGGLKSMRTGRHSTDGTVFMLMVGGVVRLASLLLRWRWESCSERCDKRVYSHVTQKSSLPGGGAASSSKSTESPKGSLWPTFPRMW
jgi:hypothetical protein